jgi:hypothetical protein
MLPCSRPVRIMPNIEQNFMPNNSQTGKAKNIRRIACSALVGSLMATGLVVILVPIPGRAENDRDIHHGREDNDKGIHAEVAALQAQVAALQIQVDKLQTQLTAVQSNNALKLGPFVSVVSGLVNAVNGPHIFLTGANIHIVSGSTTTADSVTGLGNLIIGYDELPLGGSRPGARGGHTTW